jgi:hypothetical protein
MLPFFTAFEVDKEKHTLKPYMAPVNHNHINEITWLKIVHTLLGNFVKKVMIEPTRWQWKIWGAMLVLW